MTRYDDDKFSCSKWKPKKDKDEIKHIYPNKTLYQRRVNLYSIPGIQEVIFREDRKNKPWWKFW